jgi:hypothetical protein
MSDDNTQGGAEPSLASVGSVIANIIRIAAEPEWIPVSERLPEEGQRVLTYEKPELIVVAEMHSRSVSGGLWWSTDNGHTAYSVFPTHWMPLPAPPADDK